MIATSTMGSPSWSDRGGMDNIGDNGRWVLFRSAGAQSLWVARCYNQVVPTELRVRVIEPRHGSYHDRAR
jgi:hypothetical protein